MHPKIIKARMWLAQLVAPAGADVHDPDQTCCHSDLDILEAVFFGQLRYDGVYKVWGDVTIELEDAEAAGLVERMRDGHRLLTDHGERELGRLWGWDRVPPWTYGSLAECDAHGYYDAHPGSLVGCPTCRLETGLQHVAVETTPWWARRRPARACR